jgi:signal transduction histidine kinase
MSQTYTEQLRSDASFALVPVTTFVTVTLGLLLISLYEMWYLFLLVFAAPLNGWLVLYLLRREQQKLAGTVFVAVNILLVTFVLALWWHPGSMIPYLYAIFIVISSTMIYPQASFYAWFGASLFSLFGAVTSGQLMMENISTMLLPMGVNLMLAITSFLAAMDWQVAVEAVSAIQRRAQERRDELFAIQQELSMTNARLNFLNQELERARQAALNERDLRTRFMNNVSHELRTPLNSIVNFAHILAQGARGPATESQVDYLKRIEQSGWHLLSILNDLLDMAQIEAGEFKLNLETAELQAICEEAMISIRGLILDKDVSLIRDYPDQWPPVLVDKMRLKQALINLLGNAAKYTEKGHIALRVRPNGQAVHILVEDTGIGIDPEYHELIFREFRQVDETAARRRIGNGLGLPITRHLIERHGGQIVVDSAMGKGSTFTITLPL